MDKLTKMPIVISSSLKELVENLLSVLLLLLAVVQRDQTISFLDLRYIRFTSDTST